MTRQLARQLKQSARPGPSFPLWWGWWWRYHTSYLLFVYHVFSSLSWVSVCLFITFYFHFLSGVSVTCYPHFLKRTMVCVSCIIITFFRGVSVTFYSYILERTVCLSRFIHPHFLQQSISLFVCHSFIFTFLSRVSVCLSFTFILTICLFVCHLLFSLSWSFGALLFGWLVVAARWLLYR